MKTFELDRKLARQLAYDRRRQAPQGDARYARVARPYNRNVVRRWEQRA